MKMDELRDHAARDMTFDGTELDRESLRVPQLHNKYLNFLMDERLTSKALQHEYDKLRRTKWEYYTGKMSHEQLRELGWQPFALRILKQDVELYMNSDTDLLAIRAKIEVQNEKVEYLESLIKSIMNRHWAIRSAIDWRKFTNGVN